MIIYMLYMQYMARIMKIHPRSSKPFQELSSHKMSFTILYLKCTNANHCLCIKMCLTLFRPDIPFMEYNANNAECDQTPQNAASDQGQQCLFRGISMQNTIKIKTSCKNRLN